MNKIKDKNHTVTSIDGQKAFYRIELEVEGNGLNIREILPEKFTPNAILTGEDWGSLSPKPGTRHGCSAHFHTSNTTLGCGESRPSDVPSDI
jgi:hypothetical protein